MSVETNIPYSGIIPVFFRPEVRSQLLSNLRYERFRSVESPQRFAYLLGDDVRFVSHPGITYNIAKRFIEAQSKSNGANETISREESDAMLTSAIIHDWGELKIDGRGHGDVTFDQHTVEHENEEESIFEKVLGWVCNIDDKEYLKKSYSEIVGNKSSKLGRMFNAIERIGYLSTALRAYSGWHGERIANWAGMAGNVLSNQIEPILAYSTDFVYVYQVISINSDLITQAFSDISRQGIPMAVDGKPSYIQEKYDRAKQIWENRKAE